MLRICFGTPKEVGSDHMQCLSQRTVTGNWIFLAMKWRYVTFVFTTRLLRVILAKFLNYAKIVPLYVHIASYHLEIWYRQVHLLTNWSLTCQVVHIITRDSRACHVYIWSNIWERRMDGTICICVIWKPFGSLREKQDLARPLPLNKRSTRVTLSSFTTQLGSVSCG